jgi:hypothetical protein
MLKYVSKLTLDLLPSLLATVMGAYIVNHYIIAKPGTVATATATSTLDSKAAAKASAHIPEAGVRAKGVSEKAVLDRSAAEQPQEKVQEKAQEKASEKSADKPAETASIPSDTKRRQPAPREKTAARTVPAVAPSPVQPAVSAVVPAPNTVPPVEAAIVPEEHQDANDLARAAIERLRGGNDGSPRPQEAARVQDAPRVVSAPAVPPLPQPIMVSTPSGEAVDSAAGSSQVNPPYATSARIDDPLRPTPPADIPPPRPLDLRADAAEEPTARKHATVADDVLSAAKSVFQSVLPK